MVEVENLLPEMAVFDEGRSARALAERVLVVRNRQALLGGQDRIAFFGRLMSLSRAPRSTP